MEKLPDPLKAQISGRLKLMTSAALADNTSLAQAILDCLVDYFCTVKTLVTKHPIFFLS